MIRGTFGNSKLGRLYSVKHNPKRNAAMYKRVLQKHLKASMNMTGCTTFMQDGAPCHTAGTIKEWLANHAEVPVPDWVGQSCDLNPIENLVTRLKNIIGNMKAASNLTDLAKKISCGWRILGRDTTYLHSLTYSMRSWVVAIINTEGGPTKY